MKQLYTLSLGLLCLSILSAQDNLSGIINNYAAVQSLDLCNNSLIVDEVTGFTPEQDVIIYQAQGASIDLSNSSSFGNVSDLGQAGRYEKNRILSINGNVITLAFQLSQDYDPAGKVQLISFPEFDKAIISDTLKGAPWNGSKGGVIALQVTDSLQLQAPILADGIGFRGGISDIAVSNNCGFTTNANNYAYASDNWRGAAKGEGIAIITPGSESGRGPQANGGGGGNDHNAGGGGGSNLTKAGQGGTNEEPSFFGCDGNFPGFGGRAIDSDSTRLFFGGGGGAGHENNDVGTDGGNGGGIIILLVKQLISNGFPIQSNGESPALGGGDGAGGGGGGGSILLLYEVPADFNAQALGGNGGSLDHRNADRCHGPGGGGSGGHILTNGLNPNPAIQTAGGTAGLGFNSGACADGNNSSEPGSIGSITLISSINTATQGFAEASIVSQAQDLSLCEGEDGVFGISAQGPDLIYQWQVDRGNGPEDLSNDASFQGVDTDTLRLLSATTDQNDWRFRLLISNACGANITSENADLTVSPSPVAAFTPSQNGNDFTFTNDSQNALNYNWDFGDGTMSTEFTPSHTYNQAGDFIVTLTAFGVCDTVQNSITVSITAAPTASFTSNPNEGCVPLAVNFTNTSAGNPSNITWLFPGGNPASSTEENPVISYEDPGNYDVVLIVSNTAGVDSVRLNSHVTVNPNPIAAFTPDQNGNDFTFTNNSQNASNYNWDFGDGAMSSEVSPMYTYNQPGEYTVTLTAFGICDTVQTSTTVSITGAPTASFSSSPNEGCAPLNVNFTNTSAGALSSITWVFPGGSPAFSTEENPNITYQAPGNYDVVLIVSNTAGVDSVRLNNHVVVSQVPIANFDFTVDDLTVSATDASSFADQIEWYIPALDTMSSNLNFNFSFLEAGTYDIQLTASNSCGSVTVEESITLGQAPNANFSFIPTGACEEGAIIFSNQSTGSVETYSWEFPGGMPATSTEANPTVFYENAGLYTVSLVVDGPLGQSEIVKEGAVEVLLRPNPNFDFTIDGLSVSFQNTSSDADRYTWSFGDGNTSNETNPTHVYTEEGLYDVSLNAQNRYCGLAVSQAVFIKPNATSSSDQEKDLVAFPNPFTKQISFIYRGESPLVPIRYDIYDDIGRQLERGSFQGSMGLDRPEWASGIYWVKFTMDDQTVWKKISKIE